MTDLVCCDVFFQAEDGIRDAQESRGLGDVYKRQVAEEMVDQIVFRKGALGKDGVLVGAVSYVHENVIVSTTS